LVNQANTDLARRHEELQQREDSLQERMDRMLNQRRVTMEQEFERRCTEYIESCRADFRSETDTALARYKQGRETLERQVRDLEVELKEAHEVRRGAKRALAEADAMIRRLQGDMGQLEEENSEMVHQIVELSRELQEARDSEAEACVLRQQRVQMFRGFLARVMEVAHHLGMHGLTLPTILEDDGSIIHFFSQLAEQLADASSRSWSSSMWSVGSSWDLQGRGSSPTSSAFAPTLTWRKSYRGGHHHRPALPTAKRRTGRPSWTSPCNGCRPSTPA
jgi:hypothetical protein